MSQLSAIVYNSLDGWCRTGPSEPTLLNKIGGSGEADRRVIVAVCDRLAFQEPRNLAFRVEGLGLRVWV